MAYDHDKIYGEARDALEQKTSIFVDLFNQFDQQDARVLDVGCGQGRDALFIARKGHRVVCMDISANGIRDLKDAASRETCRLKVSLQIFCTAGPMECSMSF